MAALTNIVPRLPSCRNQSIDGLNRKLLRFLVVSSTSRLFQKANSDNIIPCFCWYNNLFTVQRLFLSLHFLLSDDFEIFTSTNLKNCVVSYIFIFKSSRGKAFMWMFLFHFCRDHDCFNWDDPLAETEWKMPRSHKITA